MEYSPLNDGTQLDWMCYEIPVLSHLNAMIGVNEGIVKSVTLAEEGSVKTKR